MLTRVQAGPFTISGVSVGGIYTSLFVKELRCLLDAGMPLRSTACAESIFLSHGHADHASGLGSVMGIRGLLGAPPPKVYLPAEIADAVLTNLRALGGAHRFALPIHCHPVLPGDEFEVRPTLHARAFRTDHTGPSLGYQFFRRVEKLKPELRGLAGRQIAERKARGEAITTTEERLELAYATDTRISVLDTQPSLLKTPVLILECSFLDHRKGPATAEAGGHIHLDGLLGRAEAFENEVIVLMHFSQIYSPSEVRRVLRQRCPRSLWDRIVIFAPQHGAWPG